MIKDFKSWAEDNNKLDEGILGDIWQGVKGAWQGAKDNVQATQVAQAQRVMDSFRSKQHPINYSIVMADQLQQHLTKSKEKIDAIIKDHPNGPNIEKSFVNAVKALSQAKQGFEASRDGILGVVQDVIEKGKAEQDEPENVEATPVDNQQGQQQQGQQQQGQQQQGHTIASAGPQS